MVWSGIEHEELDGSCLLARFQFYNISQRRIKSNELAHIFCRVNLQDTVIRSDDHMNNFIFHRIITDILMWRLYMKGEGDTREGERGSEEVDNLAYRQVRMCLDYVVHQQEQGQEKIKQDRPVTTVDKNNGKQ